MWLLLCAMLWLYVVAVLCVLAAAGKGVVDTLHHNGSDVLAVAFRPDGKELVTSALDGHLYIWDAHTTESKGNIQGRHDIKGGR